MKAWYTAKQVIIESLALIEDFEQKRFEEATIHFMRTFRDFQLFHSTSFTKVWLPVTGIKTVTLPEDFIELVWIGTHFRGEIWTFTKNTRILSPSDPLQQTLNTSRHEDSNLMAMSYGYSAEGINEEGYFDLDERRNRIELKQSFLHFYNQSDIKEVYLGYIGNEITDINSAFVQAKAVNLITAGIAYQLTLSAVKPIPYIVSQREKEFIRASNLFDALSLPTADELLDVIYQTSGQGIR
jgi:hypothetical protein